METHSSEEHILAQELLRCVSNEAQNLAQFIKTLAELDTHRGFAHLGYPSLFDFSTAHLRLTQGEAPTRVRLAKLYLREPRTCEVIASGTIGMCGIRILAPILSAENVSEILHAAKGKSARELEFLKSAWQNREGTKGQTQPPSRGSIRHIELGSAEAPHHTATAGGTAGGTAPSAASNREAQSAQTATKQSDGVDTCALSNQLFSTHSALANSPTLVAARNKIRVANVATTPNSTGTPPHAPQKTTVKMVRIAANIQEDVWQKYEQACAYANKSSSARDLTVLFKKSAGCFFGERKQAPRNKNQREKMCRSVRATNSKSREKQKWGCARQSAAWAKKYTARDGNAKPPKAAQRSPLEFE